MDQNELYHYGVPGMKWGKKKAALKTDYKERIRKANGDVNKIDKATADYKKAKYALKVDKQIEKQKYDRTPEGQRKLKARKAVGTVAATAALGTIGTIGIMKLTPYIVQGTLMGLTAMALRELSD